MPAENIQDVLTDLGLSQTEQSIYLTLLQIGSSPASILGQRSGLTKSTAQYTCQQLQKKGLLMKQEKNNTYYYTPFPPERLLTLLEKREEELLRKKERVNRIVGSLKSLMNPEATLPKIQFFEGAEGIAEAYEHVLSDLHEGDEVLTYVQILEHAPSNQKINEVLDSFIEKRIAKKVRSRLITPDTKAARALQKADKQSLRTTLLVQENTFPLDAAEIFIYKDKLYSMAFERNALFATIVQNHSLATMHRAIFEISWAEAKRQNALKQR